MPPQPKISATVRRSVASLAQTRPVVGAARALTGHQLRILAFHGVQDLDHFEGVVTEVLKHHRPVSGLDVADALNGMGPLPRHAVWFTFDDGLSSTLAAGDVLAAHGVKGTAFVCPGVADPPRPHWFQIVDASARPGASDLPRKSAMKAMPDDERRRHVEAMRRDFDPTEMALDLPGDLEALKRWVDRGHEVGNHTWDHPMLDQCDEAEQRHQVRRAHEWLMTQGFQSRFLAFPNGNWASGAAKEASLLGYAGCLLFDHRLSHLRGPSDRLSRLRIDSMASPRRVQAIISGAHSGLFHLAR